MKLLLIFKPQFTKKASSRQKTFFSSLAILIFVRYYQAYISLSRTNEIDFEKKYKDKLIKNRESAKNSRKRKKIYVELLESKVQALTKQFNSYKKLCFQNDQLLSNLKGNLTIQHENENKKAMLQTRLQNCILSQQPEQQISEIIEPLLKLNENGDKNSTISHYFEQIMTNSIPLYGHYLVQAAKENKLIEQIQIDDNDDADAEENQEKQKKINLTEKQKEKISKQQEKLIAASQEFGQSMKEFNELKTQIKLEISEVQKTMNNFKQELQPSQFGKLLIDIENKKNSNELKLILENNFGPKQEDLQQETDFEIFQFMKDNELKLELDAIKVYDLYRKSYEFIKQKRQSALQIVQQKLSQKQE